jgi:hypothetical protein
MKYCTRIKLGKRSPSSGGSGAGIPRAYSAPRVHGYGPTYCLISSFLHRWFYHLRSPFTSFLFRSSASPSQSTSSSPCLAAETVVPVPELACIPARSSPAAPPGARLPRPRDTRSLRGRRGGARRCGGARGRRH